MSLSGSEVLDWGDFYSIDGTCTANVTIENMLGVIPGQSRELWLFGDSATERTISFGSDFKGEIPDTAVTSTVGLHLVVSARTTSFLSASWKVIEL